MYARCEDEAIVLADVGQNQIWAALWFNYRKPGLFLNSGGTGTMGYAFPASMGAKLANPQQDGVLRHRRGWLRDEHAGDGDDGREQHRRQRASSSTTRHSAWSGSSRTTSTRASALRST